MQIVETPYKIRKILVVNKALFQVYSQLQDRTCKAFFSHFFTLSCINAHQSSKLGYCPPIQIKLIGVIRVSSWVYKFENLRVNIKKLLKSKFLMRKVYVIVWCVSNTDMLNLDCHNSEHNLILSRTCFCNILIRYKVHFIRQSRHSEFNLQKKNR